MNLLYYPPKGADLMNSKHTLEEKQNVITAYNRGKSVSQLVTETGIPRSTIYAWLVDA